MRSFSLATAMALLACGVRAQQEAPIHVSGVFPSIVGTAESAPKRSECGVGAMMAWNNMLY